MLLPFLRLCLCHISTFRMSASLARASVGSVPCGECSEGPPHEPRLSCYEIRPNALAVLLRHSPQRPCRTFSLRFGTPTPCWGLLIFSSSSSSLQFWRGRHSPRHPPEASGRIKTCGFAGGRPPLQESSFVASRANPLALPLVLLHGQLAVRQQHYAKDGMPSPITVCKHGRSKERSHIDPAAQSRHRAPPVHNSTPSQGTTIHITSLSSLRRDRSNRGAVAHAILVV